MQIYLSQFFNNAVFTGEIISSFLIVFLGLIVSYFYKNKPYLRVALTGAALVLGIFVGQGVANTMARSAPVTGLLPLSIINAFYFDHFNLLWSIIGAQIIGMVIGLLFFIPYKIAFKKFETKGAKPVVLTKVQIGLKEVSAQIIYSLILTFVTYATFNNGLTTTSTSGLTTTLIMLIGLTCLMLCFTKVNGFMISPIINLAFKLGEAPLMKKNLNLKNLGLNFVLQTTLLIGVSALIGYIAHTISWF